MRLFFNSLSGKKILPEYNIIMSGQSIAQGQYSLASGGYTNEQIFNTNATYLECKTSNHVWQSFRDEMMSPYQYYSDYRWGCGMEYFLAEHFTNDNKKFNLYKPAWGAQKFGTDASPKPFHVSEDGTVLGSITQDIVDIMTDQKSKGIEFDYLLWMHGESDGRDSLEERGAYETNLRRFIAKIRTIQPDIPFLIRILPEETESWMGAINAGGRDAINTAINNVVADTPNCYSIEMPEPFSQGDLIHPSNPLGNSQMAQAYWNKLKTLIV